ncbi:MULTISPECIES: hypothetical protein [Psychrilyobacter]|uniref:Uncharacterized protein n=1 Tax=Psychrilyobacter piezotolerans TaxID=2293438 RepID=A0ABX9KJZ9_9FUSO|nr:MULTISPECIES: hypothetical protein [Psychrilyobacter]MCS5420528.1 hypothetical protein [Psychrilyobacter sp. S5]NDI76912.1 hypothetical protein [Psychrilyobacter piezotolerans]RDE65189.1 hypothetical protein DV867_03050 [Psychrilyobacter sp. S5]REI42759.1 hypothetical protein DYH56_03050 [Psychrilyobacter piezotolerans]
MYKYILLLVLALSTASCTGVSKVKERYHRAPFEKEIKKGDYELTLYSINYPQNYEEKIKFYDDFDILMRKLLVYDSTINMMYSQKFKDDIIHLKNSYILPEEAAFSKSASELSQVDRDSIDEKVAVKLDEKIGRTQYYLNKQVYFWKKIMNSDEKFNSEATYTELDKEKLILQMEDKRKKLFKVAEQVELNLILKIKDPYSHDENEYWQEKDVYIDRSTDLTPKVFKEQGYIYLSDVEDRDVKKIMGNQLNFDSKIVVVENRLYNGYTVSAGKYIFFYGGKYRISYYNGYNLEIKVKEVSLKDLLTVDEEILIDDFLNPKSYKERQEK